MTLKSSIFPLLSLDSTKYRIKSLFAVGTFVLRQFRMAETILIREPDNSFQ